MLSIHVISLNIITKIYSIDLKEFYTGKLLVRQKCEPHINHTCCFFHIIKHTEALDCHIQSLFNFLLEVKTTEHFMKLHLSVFWVWKGPCCAALCFENSRFEKHPNTAQVRME